MNLSSRDRWLAALLPVIVIAGGYLYFIDPGLNEELERETRRAETYAAPPAEAKPLPARPGGPVQSPAAIALAETKKGVAEREVRIAELQRKIGETVAPTAPPPRSEAEATAIVERLEAVLARHKVEPLVSEPSPAESREKSLASLAELLAPKAPVVAADSQPAASGPASAGLKLPVWHCVLDGSCPRFRAALSELIAEVPSAVPLGFNLVYNPENSGASRLLEIWLAY